TVPYVDTGNGNIIPMAVPGGTLDIDNAADQAESYSLNLWASGPIIEDKLFYYVLFNPRSSESDNYAADSGLYFQNSDDDAFWGAKVDWLIGNDHKIEFTAFSDKSDV